jgi:two-component system response regulator AtoC
MPADQADRPRILVVDDEVNMGRILTKLLTLEGFDVRAFSSPTEALQQLPAIRPLVVLSDLRMPGLTGEELLERVKREDPSTEVLLMTAYGTVDSAMRCVRQGAFDYVTKPFETDALLAAVKKAAAKALLARPQEAPATDDMIGESPALIALRELVGRFAPVDAPVLILGESGTGKELVARALHRRSPRRHGPLVTINCASIPETLLESELFGHERGAFTGAQEEKIGLAEAANGGTLFLDEIGEMPLALQAKLLRLLQEREITRVGAVHPRPVNIRVLAATHRPLLDDAGAGRFREDLYYRLHVLSIHLPALRDRPQDIPLLAEFFLGRCRQELGRPGLRWDSNALADLASRPWRGNVRELENTVQRLAIMTDGDVIATPRVTAAASSQGPLGSQPERPEGSDPATVQDYWTEKDEFEADYLRRVLRACAGNVSEAARRSGMSRRNLYEKLEKLGLNPESFK